MTGFTIHHPVCRTLLLGFKSFRRADASGRYRTDRHDTKGTASLSSRRRIDIGETEHPLRWQGERPKQKQHFPRRGRVV